MIEHETSAAPKSLGGRPPAGPVDLRPGLLQWLIHAQTNLGVPLLTWPARLNVLSQAPWSRVIGGKGTASFKVVGAIARIAAVLGVPPEHAASVPLPSVAPEIVLADLRTLASSAPLNPFLRQFCERRRQEIEREADGGTLLETTGPDQ